MNIVTRFLGGLIDCALDRMTPVDVHARSYLAMSQMFGPDNLADLEAGIDVWERDDHLPDDLWAARQRARTDQPASPGDNTAVSPVAAVTGAGGSTHSSPVGAVVPPPASATGADGPPQSPASADGHPPNVGAGGLTRQVAAVIAVVLRRHDIRAAPVYADLIAQELAHHFTVSHK